MPCPRCGGDLVEYRLDGREAFRCEACGYVGVPTDHHGSPTPSETWAESLRRFRRRHGSDATAYRTLRVGPGRYRVSPALHDEISNRTEKQRAVLSELLREPDPTDPDRTLTAIAEAAGVHRSYVNEVVDRYGELAVALKENEIATA